MFKIYILFLMIFSLYSQGARPTDSNFAAKFVGIYRLNSDTSLNIESMNSYLKASGSDGRVYHFLWLGGLNFNIQGDSKNLNFTENNNQITTMEIYLYNRKRVFTKIQ